MHTHTLLLLVNRRPLLLQRPVVVIAGANVVEVDVGYMLKTLVLISFMNLASDRLLLLYRALRAQDIFVFFCFLIQGCMMISIIVRLQLAAVIVVS